MLNKKREQREDNREQRGAVILLSVLIIGFVISAIMISASLYGRLSVLSSKMVKESGQTKYSAEACVEKALLEIYNNTSYTGSGSISDGDIDCSYTVTDEGGSFRSITSSSTINNLNYYNEVDISLGTQIEITSWKRVESI